MSATDKLVDYIESLRYEDLPTETVTAVKTHILDTIGAIMAGSNSQGPKMLLSLIREWGGRAEGTILIYGDRVPLHHAAWANTVMSRGYDFESLLSAPGATHVPACIVPAALALAEYSQAFRKKAVNGRELITAIALGNDLNGRFRISGRESTAQGGGWLAETFAPPAIAALGGKMLGFDREKIYYAMGIGYNQCCGTYGATVGPGCGYIAQLSQGLGTKAGVLAVILAERGFTAYKEMIDGRWGLYRMYANGDYDPELLLGGLGRRFEILNPNIKRYPGCGATQSTTHAVLEMAREHKIKAEDVEMVSLRVSEGQYWLCGEDKTEPLTTADALWNYRYLVALALLKGKVFVDDISEESIRDPRVLELIGRIDVKPEKSLSRAVNVQIRTRDGRQYGKKDFTMPPMSRAEILEKFRKCNRFSARPLPEKSAEAFIRMVDNLEEVDNAAKIISQISPARK